MIVEGCAFDVEGSIFEEGTYQISAGGGIDLQEVFAGGQLADVELLRVGTVLKQG